MNFGSMDMKVVKITCPRCEGKGQIESELRFEPDEDGEFVSISFDEEKLNKPCPCGYCKAKGYYKIEL